MKNDDKETWVMLQGDVLEEWPTEPTKVGAFSKAWDVSLEDWLIKWDVSLGAWVWLEKK